MYQRLLCDGGCPHNGNHHANHYNVKVYDLDEMKTISSFTVFDHHCSAVLSELKAIYTACKFCHHSAVVYNDSKEAIGYIKNGVPDTNPDFIRLRKIIDKINRQLLTKSVEIKWWNNSKNKNFADCKSGFEDVKRSAWKARYA